MKYLKLFENNKLKFYIDIRKCSNEEKMKILNLIEEISPIIYNGENSKKDFINKKDTQGLAWCWAVKKVKGSFNNIDYFHISGIHTYNWGMPEIGNMMITGEKFIEIGPENIELFFKIKDYNL
jgi:hypothetical protein